MFLSQAPKAPRSKLNIGMHALWDAKGFRRPHLNPLWHLNPMNKRGPTTIRNGYHNWQDRQAGLRAQQQFAESQFPGATGFEDATGFGTAGFDGMTATGGRFANQGITTGDRFVNQRLAQGGSFYNQGLDRLGNTGSFGAMTQNGLQRGGSEIANQANAFRAQRIGGGVF